MKKVISICVALALVMGAIPTVIAARLNSVEKNEAEALRITKSQGDYQTVLGDGFSGGSAVELNVTKYDEWLKNDYIRFAVPINQRAVFNIRVGVRKGPDQGIMQLWFSDINTRIGQKIDLYSPTEEYVEIDLGNHTCNIQYTGRWFEFRVDGKNDKSSGANINVDYIQHSYVSEYKAPSAEIPYYGEEAPMPYGDEPYAWGNVKEGGTGRSSRLVVHPMEEGLMYMGTDMGGMYRWDNDTYTWKSLSDRLPADKISTYLGIDGIAVDPNNPDIVYAAVGISPKKEAGTVLKSYDRGETWIETGFEGHFSANVDPSRRINERIGVDPANSNNVWVGTVNEGLFRSKDGFKTWEQVTLPVTLEKIKVFPSIVAFDETTKTENGCSRIYVAVYDYGLLVTNDGGNTWETVEDCPAKRVSAMNFSNDGTFAVATIDAGLWTYKDGVWKDISPNENKVWSEVAISRTNSDYMITSWFYGPVGSYGQYTYYTLDGGENWILLNDNFVRNHTVTRQEWGGGFFCNVSDIEIDPFNPARVFTVGWGNFQMTEDIFAEKPVFTNYIKGVEHGCSANMVSLPVGARLIIGAYDYGGGRFTDVTQYCNEMLPPKEANPARVAFCENDPNFIVRAGKGHGVYSTDNGINWRSLGAYPEEIESVVIHDVVVSSDVHPETGIPVISLIGYNQPPFVTFDLGKTWIKSEGADNWFNSSKWGRGKRLAADNNAPQTLYYLAKTALYRSDDWGLTYEKVSEFNAGEYNSSAVKTSFGKDNGVFVSDSGSGKLFRSTDQGENFKEIGNFTFVRDFAFGKERDENSPATLYVWGKNDGVLGIYKSHDNGATWENIYDHATANRKLVTTMVICADRQTYGIVYVGSSGHGIKYGVPAGQENIYYTNKDDAVKVMINNQLEIFDVEPQIINDRTMVPMRKIFEDVGAVVSWDEETRTVTTTRKVSDNYGVDETTVSLTIGSNKITINGQEHIMDVVPQIVGGRTMVPVRFISEALGAEVSWDEEKQLVKIVI